MLFQQFKLLLKISHSQSILRRYFVVNGFDGALTMLGLIIGFVSSSFVHLSVVINACLGASFALFISGVNSAYISERAERQRTLAALESAMLLDLNNSVHGQAARYIPIAVALVNGFAPLIISLLIISPLWLAQSGVNFFIAPLYVAASVALFLIFLLGVFLGQVSGRSFWLSGFKSLIIGLITLMFISLFIGD